ncbi:MAG: class I SAM-dependent methyltransferase [Solirubrobacteraceae bacterium]
MSLESESADPCDLTLATYEAVADAYAERNRTPDPVGVPLLDRLVELVGDGRVLELGSAPGTDADYLERQGVKVIRTDAADAFVEMMRARGIDARRLDVRTGEFGGPYDAVLANAVLANAVPLHLTSEQLLDALCRLRAAVRLGGVLAFSVKEGDGAEWTTAKVGRPRYFIYWREGPLRALLTRAGWTVESLQHVAGLAEDWLFVIAD